MVKKLNKVQRRRYIAKGYVVSLTSFFAVPKGEADIRMVYDATISGLNNSMWVPRFAMSNLETHLRVVEDGTYLSDIDIGECFLNFVLHKSIRSLAGVDLTLYTADRTGVGDEPKQVWETW